MNDAKDLDIPRTTEQIARRSLVLHCIIAAAYGVSKPDISDWLQEEGLWEELSPREAQFMAQEKNSESEISWMVWLIEAQVTLLWSIQKIDDLPSLTSQCDTGPVVDAMPELFESTSSFIKSSVRRDLAELKRYEKNLYDIRCELVNAQKSKKTSSKGVNKDVAFFRHYGLNWVVGYCSQAWDEITPDT